MSLPASCPHSARFTTLQVFDKTSGSPAILKETGTDRGRRDVFWCFDGNVVDPERKL